jgi:hypothetical protein
MVSNLLLLVLLIEWCGGRWWGFNRRKRFLGDYRTQDLLGVLGEWEGLIAGKPAPTGFCVVHNVGYTTEHCGSWLASDGASPDTTTFRQATKSPPIGGLLVFT